MSFKNKVITYLVGSHVGLSAGALIGNYFFPHSSRATDHPWDVGDLERCIIALDAIEEPNVDFMKLVSPQWAKLASEWTNIIELYESGNRHKCYLAIAACTSIGEGK